MALQSKIQSGIQQWVAGAYESRQGLSLRSNQIFFERDPFVSLQNRIARTNLSITVTDRRRHMRQFVPSGFAPANGPAELLKCLNKKRFDVIGLKAPGLSPFHVFTNTRDPAS